MTKPSAQDAAVRKFWVPPSPETTQMYQFMQKINQTHGLSIGNYWDLMHSQFWSDWFDHARFIHVGSYARAVDERQPIDAVPKWFEGININFAENFLFARDLGSSQDTRDMAGKEDGKIAVTEVGEGGTGVRHFNWAALRHDTSLLASALKARGISRGDRVFAIVSNLYQTLTLFLAVSWVGGIFSSTSTDMGTEGVLQRARQIGPKLVFMDDSTKYNGRDIDLMSKASNILAQLSKEASVQRELVAYKPFPNVPVFFCNDIPARQSPKSRYFSSYFANYEYVCAHGDVVSVHPTTRAIVFHGRADGVLNPSGIRFESSEIYSIIERHFSDVVMESMCVGQRRANDPDETVLLFLQMRPGHKLTQKTVEDIRKAIKTDLSSRHVPKHVFEVPEIPVTATFKKVELPVKHIVSGRTAKPSGTIVNPNRLDFFYQFADIEKYMIKAKL
ncbi:hypothetical protein FOBRF1_012087 [Fusarium oxysporum]